MTASVAVPVRLRKAPKPLWDILVCSIPHRHAELLSLLAHLDTQISTVMGVRVLVFRDNLQFSYGHKCQTLVEASTAKYINFLDDDDWVPDDYIATIREALDWDPDYVGFRVRWTKDGKPMLPVEHSLHYDGWRDYSNVLLRDINQFNPIRRHLALLGTWEGGNGADRRWSDQVRASGQVRSEVWLNREMLHYRDASHDTFLTPRQPLPGTQLETQLLPQYPWLVYVS